MTGINVNDYDYAALPGTFEGNEFRRAAAYVHEITLNGFTAEECGTIEYGPGWYGLVYLDIAAQENVEALGWKRDGDAAPESKPVAAIVHEDDRGFVTVRFYDSEDAAQADFAEAEAEYDALDGEDDDANEPTSEPEILNINYLTRLTTLAQGVQSGRRAEWFPNGDETATRTVDGIMNCFAHDGGGFLTPDEDIRDHHIHISGMFEYWLPVRDVLSWMEDGVFVVH